MDENTTTPEPRPEPERKRDHRGSRNPNAKPVLDRIMAKVTLDPATGCEVWAGGRFISGDPRIWLNGRYHRAADVLWEYRKGPKPPGEVLVRLCEKRTCVSPDHHMLIIV